MQGQLIRREVIGTRSVTLALASGELTANCTKRPNIEGDMTPHEYEINAVIQDGSHFSSHRGLLPAMQAPEAIMHVVDNELFAFETHF